MKMKIAISIFFITVFIAQFSAAQIPTTSIVEHFTNTSCSVCAANNGNIYTAISNHPGVLHISFHPSSPYSSDYFNQQNMFENDARTMFYGLFGSTPRIALNGLSIPYFTLNTTLNNATLLMSNYHIDILQTQVAVDSFRVRTVITKIAMDNNTTALLFLGASEDTIFYTTNNGETTHLNVFRRAITSVTGDTITLPIYVGDSIVNNYYYLSDGAWNVTRMNTIGILQKTTKEVLNSAKSINAVNLPSGIENTSITDGKTIIYPNPIISDKLYLNEDIEAITIYNLIGERQLYETEIKRTESISVSSLQPGVYIVEIVNGKDVSFHKILKQ